MENHWYIIVDGKGNERKTIDLQEALKALEQRKRVNEVREQVMYMENAVIRISAIVEMKRPSKRS